MEQKRKTKNRSQKKMMLSMALVILTILVLALVLGRNRRPSVEASVIQEGLSFLTQQEQKNPDVIRQARKTLHNRRLQAQKDELLKKMESGEVDPFTLLQDFVVMGDSRTTGFYFFGFLPEERTMGANVNMITNIPDWHDQLKQMQPQYVFLCYGVNDCAYQMWSSGEEHAADYMEYIRELQQMLPNTTFVVSSILLVQDFAIADYPAWENLPEWNVALEKACKEAGIPFADCDYLFEEYNHLWLDDGFHFDAGVYRPWTSTMVATALYGNLAEEA